MPNWCNNIATLNHEDPAMIVRIKNALESGLFNEFVPMPLDLSNTPVASDTAETVYQKNKEAHGYASWYDFACDKWGTKWDANCAEILDEQNNSIKLSFDTAWSPPIAFYEAMDELGFTIEAYYSETGMCFVGSYTSEGGDDYVEYDASSMKALRQSCPSYFIDMFSLEDWFDEEEEEAE